MFLAGVPIAISLGLSGVLGIVLSGTPLTIIPHRLFYGADSYIMLAIPLFLLTGELMNIGGITKRLIRFSQSAVGHIIGGLAQVNILTSMLFAGTSGSAVADVAGIGAVLIPAMKKEGYDADFSAAVTASSSICGPIIPPSIPMILYGVLTGTSIGGLFLGGVIPGIIMGISLMMVTYIISRKRKYKPYQEKRSSFINLLSTGIHAILAIIMPLIIVVGILGGIFTPTEAAAVAVAYSVLVGWLIYRELTLKGLISAFRRVVHRSAIIMFAIACASVFGWVLTSMQVPQRLVIYMMGITGNAYVVLLLINIFLLIIGTFISANAALIIMAPLFLPLIQSYAIDPLHFGVVMVLNLMLGLLTPPVGTCLYLAADIAEITVEKTVVALLPFLVIQVLVLLLITYVPIIVLFLPRLLLG